MKYFSELHKLRVEVDVFKVITLVFSLVIAFQTWIIVQTNTNVKTVILPSNISKPFSYTNNVYSQEYFDDVGFLVSGALLNVSPDNVMASFDKVAKYFTTEPKQRKEVKDYLLEQAENIRLDDISQAFYPKKVIVDYDKNIFYVHGNMTTLSGNVFVSNKKTSVEFNFKVENSQLIITKFTIK